jgi:DNA invertase Pin-like site-specific DNA recombinase
MFRSATDALNVADLLKKTGVSLHLLDVGDVTSNGIGRVFFTVIASFAQFERERIAERVAEVKAGERAKHSFLGGHRPFGFDVTDGVLAPNPTEQDALATARSMRAGGGSFRSIAKHLRGLGVNVSHVTVARILNTEQKSYLPV